jgi:hypothetical protein
MNLRKLALAAAAVTTLFAAAPAFSEPRDWARDRDHGWQRDRDHRWQDRRPHHSHYRAPDRAYYPPQRIVERVVVVPAAPVYYPQQQSRPVISGQIPIGRDRNINVEFQL